MVAAASLLLGVWAGRTVGLPSVESLLAEGQLQQALAVVSTMPEGPERLFYQARCLEADAQRGDAALAYARLAQGDSPYQQAARARLKSLLPLVGCQDDAEPSGPVAQVSLRAPCPVLRAAPVP